MSIDSRNMPCRRRCVVCSNKKFSLRNQAVGARRRDYIRRAPTAARVRKMDKHTLALEALLIGFDFGANVKDDPMCVVHECAKLTDTLVTRFAESPPRASVLFECLRQAMCDDDPASAVVDWITNLLQHRCVKLDDVVIDDDELSFLMCCTILLKFNALYFELRRIRNALNEEARPIELHHRNIHCLPSQIAHRFNRFLCWESRQSSYHVPGLLEPFSHDRQASVIPFTGYEEVILCCIGDNIELYKYFFSSDVETFKFRKYAQICFLCNSDNIYRLLTTGRNLQFNDTFVQHHGVIFSSKKCPTKFEQVISCIKNNDYEQLDNCQPPIESFHETIVSWSEILIFYCIYNEVDFKFIEYFIRISTVWDFDNIIQFCVCFNRTAILEKILIDPWCFCVSKALVLSLVLNRTECFSLLRIRCSDVEIFKKYAVSPEMRRLFE